MTPPKSSAEGLVHDTLASRSVADAVKLLKFNDQPELAEALVEFRRDRRRGRRSR